MRLSTRCSVYIGDEDAVRAFVRVRVAFGVCIGLWELSAGGPSVRPLFASGRHDSMHGAPRAWCTLRRSCEHG